jgi:hypothetical protein
MSSNARSKVGLPRQGDASRMDALDDINTRGRL